MRKVFVLMFFLITCKYLVAQNKPDANFHLYLLVGQSNMAGRGKVDSLSSPNNNRLLMLTKENEWVIAKDPLHFDKPRVAGVGPGLRFAETMLSYAKNKNVRIGLIPCAVGGTAIESWQPGAEALGVHPYDDAILRLHIAMKSGVLKGIIWHQGEGNSSESKSKVYVSQLEALIERFRAESGDSIVPFVAGELGYYRPRYQLINAVLKDLPQKVQNTSVASAEGLTHKGDTTHLDSRSARILGERFAEKMDELQKNSSTGKPTSGVIRGNLMISPCIPDKFDFWILRLSGLVLPDRRQA
jgi:hypothetical protein